MIESLSNKFLYITYAVCEDDTGNNYIQGLLYGDRRYHHFGLRKLIGNAMFSIPSDMCETYQILTTIQLNQSFKEIGNCGKAMWGSYVINSDRAPEQTSPKPDRKLKPKHCSGIPQF